MSSRDKYCAVRKKNGCGLYADIGHLRSRGPDTCGRVIYFSASSISVF